MQRKLCWTSFTLHLSCNFKVRINLITILLSVYNWVLVTASRQILCLCLVNIYKTSISDLIFVPQSDCCIQLKNIYYILLLICNVWIFSDFFVSLFCFCFFIKQYSRYLKNSCCSTVCQKHNIFFYMSCRHQVHHCWLVLLLPPPLLNSVPQFRPLWQLPPHYRGLLFCR